MRLSKSTAASALIAAMAAVCLVASSAPAQAANPSYLITVQAVAGSTVLGQTSKGEDERFTLTMRGVDPVTKFADRPLRAGEAPQSIVVTLTKPRYERAGHTLTFTASRTYRTVEPSEKGKGWKRPATPRTFTSVSLFIDDAGDSQAGALTAQLQQSMQQYVFQPNNASTWAAVASAMSSILTTAWQQGTLMGPAATSAFTVNCQPSAQQILNGYLSCAVSMQLASGENYTTTLTQMMATSG